LLSEAAAAAGPPGPLVVDISGLDFIGCCAYAALAEEAERCRNRGVEMRLVTNQPVVSRILKACGLGAALPVDVSVDAALSTCILVDC
jgi:anti-anti-sigma factor